jgi:predicted ester cyclase
MSTEANEAKTRRYFEELWNQRNLDVIEDWIAPEYVGYYSSIPDELRGVDGFRGMVGLLLAALPDLQMTVEDVIARDDRVVTRFTARGTHEGELQGFAPTGVRVAVAGIGIERYGDGKCVEEWVVSDDMGLARQIRAMPAPGSRGERAAILMHRLTARRLRKQDGVRQ